MPIEESDVEVGYVYSTPNNQLRLVLKINDGSLRYSSAGGNVSPKKFDLLEPETSRTRFAQACSKKEYKMKEELFQEIKGRLPI